MSVFQGMNISASGLTAERLRMDVIAGNIANQNTTRTDNGEAYRRRVAVFAEDFRAASVNSDAQLSGVRTVEIIEDQSDFQLVYDPTHPDANEDGYVSLPNVDVLNEMIDLMVASRAYEANVTALNATQNMYMRALEIGR